MSIGLESTVKAARGQVSCDVAGEAVILDANQGMYYGLDAVGARVWDLLQEPVSLSLILDTLLAEYDVAPDRCQTSPPLGGSRQELDRDRFGDGWRLGEQGDLGIQRPGGLQRSR